MSDDSKPERSDPPRADEVLKRWSEFAHPRTLLIEVTLSDETWAAIARMIEGREAGISKFTEEALELYVDEIIRPDPEDGNDKD
jgi:hypothetical protein